MNTHHDADADAAWRAQINARIDRLPGLGHVGGAVQPYIVLPVLAAFGARAAFVLLIAASVLAFIIMFSAVLTTGRQFSEIAR